MCTYNSIETATFSPVFFLFLLTRSIFFQATRILSAVLSVKPAIELNPRSPINNFFTKEFHLPGQVVLN